MEALQEFNQAMDKPELQALPQPPALTKLDQVQAQPIKLPAQSAEQELPLTEQEPLLTEADQELTMVLPTLLLQDQELVPPLAQPLVLLPLELPQPPPMAQLLEEPQEPLQELPLQEPLALLHTEAQELPPMAHQAALEPLEPLEADHQLEPMEPLAMAKEPLVPHTALELQAASPALNQAPHTDNLLAAAFPPQPLAAKATPQPTKEPLELLEPLALPQADSAHPEQDPQVHHPPTTPSKPKNTEQ